MEDNTAVLQMRTMSSSNPTSGHRPKNWMQGLSYLYTHVHGSIFTRTKMSKHPSVHQWMGGLIECGPSTQWNICVCVCMSTLVLSHVCVTPWTIALQAPLSMEFSMQEYWNGLPFPTPGDLPDPGIEPACLASPALAGGFFTTAPLEKTGFPRWLHGKESTCQAGDMGSIPGSGRSPGKGNSNTL